MTTSTNDLIERTRGLLYSGQAETANRLDGAISSPTATSFALKYSTTGITTGSILSVDLEEIRVWEISGQTVSVCERGVNGSAKATHSDLAMVAVRPKFSSFRILQAINDDLADLSTPMNGLFWAKPLSITTEPGIVGYDLAGVAHEQDVLRVSHSIPGSTSQWWPEVPAEMWRVEMGMDTSVFPSGIAIFFAATYSNAAYRVIYKAPFSALSLTDLTVDVATSGLPDTAIDLPPMGAAISLVFPREIKRNFTETQSEPRRATEVPPGATTGSISGLRARRRERIAAEASRLNAAWPAYTRTGGFVGMFR